MYREWPCFIIDGAMKGENLNREHERMHEHVLSHLSLAVVDILYTTFMLVFTTGDYGVCL